MARDEQCEVAMDATDREGEPTLAALLGALRNQIAVPPRPRHLDQDELAELRELLEGAHDGRAAEIFRKLGGIVS